VLKSRTRALLFGVLAVMLAGSIMAATASAIGGPYWHHRAIGGEGEGAKIESKAPENFKGEGGAQTFKGKIGTTEFEIAAKSEQVKGAIFNNSMQGQIKLELIYNQPELLKPTIAGCVVTVGQKNVVQAKGHLMWKWDGTAAQLKEESQAAQVPDLAFTPIEIPEGATELPKGGAFTTITFNSKCGALVGTFNVGGTEAGLPSPSHIGEWSRKLAVSTVEGKELLQHFYNGKVFIGAKLGLELGGNPASLIGQTQTESAQQEVAVFEK
jgi:hypothetical protein